VKKGFEFEIGTDKTVVVKGGSTQRIIELFIKAPEKKTKERKVALNLALVVDRSGSMSGIKLEFARQAALHVVDILAETDRVSLVTFDDHVNRVFPPVRLTAKNRADLRAAIRQIQSGGSTNLSGGWLTGCQAIAETQVENGLNRALLLTDGCANVGIVDPTELGYHAAQLNERGISTTTIGVGLDFDHFLLEKMSEMGGGNYYFIEDPRSIPTIFTQELHELVQVTARAVEIILKNPAGGNVEVFGGWQSRNDAGDTHILLGDLASGQEKRLYLRYTVSPRQSDQSIPLPFMAFAHDENDQMMESSTLLEFTCVSSDEEARAKVDEDLMRRFAIVDNADAAREALILEQQGERKRARDLLHRRTRMNAPSLNESDISYYEALSNRLEHGLDESDRKTSHFNENLRRKIRER